MGFFDKTLTNYGYERSDQTKGLAVEQKDYTTASGALGSIVGANSWNPAFSSFNNEKQQLLAYRDWVYIAARAVAEQCAAVDLRLFENHTKVNNLQLGQKLIENPRKAAEYMAQKVNYYETKNGIVTYRKNSSALEELDVDPLLTLINHPNPYMVKNEFLEITFLHLELTGNAYWFIARDKKGKPKELWPLLPNGMAVVPDETHFVIGYVYTTNGKQIPLDPEDVVHHKYGNPMDFRHGYSAVMAGSVTIDADTHASIFNQRFFYNSAMPDGFLTTEESLDEKTFKRLKTEWMNNYSGAVNAHRTAILSGGLQYKNLQIPQRDMEFLKGRNFNRDMIMALFGVPKSILGFDESMCYDEDTEILTENGFKKYYEVKDGEKLATANQETNRLEYQDFSNRYVYDHDGEMVSVETKNLSLLVTPNHKMWQRTQKKKDYRLIEARDLTTEFYVKAAFDYDAGEEITTVKIPAVKNTNNTNGGYSTGYEVDADVFLEYLGYYISEGGLRTKDFKGNIYAHSIAQKKTDNNNVEHIRECLDKTDFSVTESVTEQDGTTRWNIYGKSLNVWLRDNCGRDCVEKRVPRQFMNLSKRQLRILFDALMLGDGSWDKRDNRASGYYSSTSPQLASDVQEIAIKLGYSVSKKVHYEAHGNRKECYTVHICERTEHQVRENTTTITYKGKVWCFEVPNHLLIVRRKGTITAQGNSRANADTAEYVFSKRVRIKMQRLTNRITMDLAPQMGKNLIMSFTDPVPEDKAQVLEDMVASLGGTNTVGFATPNEVRAKRGDLPVPGGDDIYVPLNLAPMGKTKYEQNPEGTPADIQEDPGKPEEEPDVNDHLDPDEDGADDTSGGTSVPSSGVPDSGSTSNETSNSNRAIEDSKKKQLIETIKSDIKALPDFPASMLPPTENGGKESHFLAPKTLAVTPATPQVRTRLFTESKAPGDFIAQKKHMASVFEVKFLRSAKDRFDQQKAEVLYNVQSRFVYGTKSISGLTKKDAKSKLDNLFDIVASNAAWIAALIPTYKALATSSGKLAVDLLNNPEAYSYDADAPETPISYSDSSAEINKLLDSRASEVSEGIDSETSKQLKASLTEGLNSGESLQQLSDRVEQVFSSGSITGYRSQRIARTETHQIMQDANTTIWKNSGMVESYVWLCGGPNPCNICLPLNNVVKSDPTDFPTEHVNGACDVIPYQLKSLADTI